MDFPVIILLIILGFQLLSFFRTLKNIQKLSKLFPNPKTLDIQTVDLELFSYDEILCKESVSDEFKNIITNTNKFLSENKGTAADFNILKDISERESDKLERSVIATIAVPIYLGLIGTITGIFISLYFLDFPIQDKSFEKLISGASIAMMASGMGIILTLLNSSYFFKKSKLVRDSYRNEYYTFLQVKLMPSLNNDMNSSLKNIKVVLEKFNEEFSFKFEKNISTFKESITIISQNLEHQKSFLNLLNKSRLNEIIKTNSTLLDKIETSSNQLFSKLNSTFSGVLSKIKSTEIYFNKLDDILSETNKTMDIMNSSSQKMNEVFNEAIGSKDKLQTIFVQAGESIENSNRLIQFLKDYYKDLEDLKSGSEKTYNSLIEHLSNISEMFLKDLSLTKSTNIELINNHFDGFKNYINVITNENTAEIKSIVDNNKNWLENNQTGELLNELKNGIDSINNVIMNPRFNSSSENGSVKLISLLEENKTDIELLVKNISHTNKLLEDSKDEHKQKGIFNKLFGQ